MKFRPVPDPVVGPSDVLIRVHAASLNPVDYKLRSGAIKRVVKLQFPFVMGHDGAGVVVAAGSSVKRFKAGDEVYFRPERHQIGTLAELIRVNEATVAHKPKNISFEEAASFALIGLTVWQTFHEWFHLKRGDRVFIPAGSGGIGSFAVQLGRVIGAEVISNCSTKNVEMVRALGASQVIDYTKEDFAKVVQPVDYVFDTMGGETQRKAFGILKEGGTMISIVGPPTKAMGARMGLPPYLQWGAGIMGLPATVRARLTGTHYDFIFMRPDGGDLEKIRALVESGEIKPVVDKVYPFEEANVAMEYLEKGHARGKVVVRVKV